MKLPWKRESLGLDMGTRLIKALKLRKNGRRVVLEACYLQDLMGNHEDLVGGANVASVLTALVETRELKGSAAHLSIPDSEILRFDLVLPQMPDRELNLAIRNEIESKINFPIEDACVDYLSSKEGSSSVKAQTFVTRRERVDQQLKAVKSAHLNAQSLESDMLALNDTLEFNGYLNENSSQILVDFGHAHTSIAHFVGLKLNSVHTVPYGSGQLLRALCGKLDCTYAHADALLLGNIQADNHESVEILNELVNEHNQQILGDIETSLRYFQELSVSKPIQNIYLSGGGSRSDSLRDLIVQAFEMPVERIDPFKSLDILKAEVASDIVALNAAPLMAVAVGLALRGVL